MQVTYASPYLFIGPIAGWFGGTFTTANLTAVASDAATSSHPSTREQPRTFSGVEHMNRNTRTTVVVGVAVTVAALASFGVYRAIQQMPVRQVEVRSLYQVVAAMDMPMGTLITKDQVKLVAWPASSPVNKRLYHHRERHQPRPHRLGRPPTSR